MQEAKPKTTFWEIVDVLLEVFKARLDEALGYQI